MVASDPAGLTHAHAPALADADAGADIAQAEGEVDAAVVLGDPVAAACVDPVLLDEHDLLNRVVEPGLGEDRTPLLLQRELGDPGRAVRRADRREGRYCENQRPKAGGQRRDRRRPVDGQDEHPAKCATTGALAPGSRCGWVTSRLREPGPSERRSSPGRS